MRLARLGLLWLLVLAAPAAAARPEYIVHAAPSLDGAVPLVVVIHGCNVTAQAQRESSGYDAVADREGFVVLYPDNDDGAHAGGCWRWYEPSSWYRDDGDPAALATMTRAVMAKYPIDPERVYVIGMSSGGLITSNLVASYPDLFAAFGLMAGGPYRGVGCLSQSVGNDPRTLAADARDAEGDYARVLPFIVLHGDRDYTVPPSCGTAATEQWLRTDNLVASGGQDGPLSLAPARVEAGTPKAGGYPFDVEHYTDPGGCEVAQRWDIHGMEHYWSGGSNYKVGDPRGPSATEASWAFFERYRRSETDLPCAEAAVATPAPQAKPTTRKRPRRCRHRKYRKRHPKRCRRR